MGWKSLYRKVPILSCLVPWYLGWNQDRKIHLEQKEYEVRARAMELPFGEEEPHVTFGRLRNRLAKRGISWPPKPIGKPLHILYISVPGIWERHNIPTQLKKLGETSFFFLDEQGITFYENISPDSNWIEVRRQVDMVLPGFVWRLHKRKPIDLILSYFSGSQISPPTIRAIKEMGIPIFSFHLDDRLSFRGRMIGDQWSGPCAVCRAYDLNLSNSLVSLAKYRVEGAEVLFWPEGANPEFFRPLNLQFEHDVSFVGARYGKRPLLINHLRKQGIRVDCFGSGWEHSFLTPQEMIKVYNQSRINLGFGYVGFSSDQCLKGRDFEVPACGAVYLTSHNENLVRVYRIGEEVETYSDFEDCAKKIRALLANPERCDRMRKAARKAVVERHSWAQRIAQFLNCQGCPWPPGNSITNEG